MKATSNPSSISIVDVCGKRTPDYVLECLAKFNRGTKEVILRSTGRNASKAIIIAQILSRNFNIRSKPSRIYPLEIFDTVSYCLEINLILNANSRSIKGANNTEEEEEKITKLEYIKYPRHHLLLDSLLSQKGKLEVSTNDSGHLIDIIKSNSGIKCILDKRYLKDVNYMKWDDKKVLQSLRSVYYRCGLLLSPMWKAIAESLSRFDDIVIGVDTNILYTSVLTEQLFSSLSVIDPIEYVYTPNWILIVICSTVMHELEQAANIRDNKGMLQLEGRMAFRALQEIIEIDQSPDLPGISLFIVGETDPVLDTKIELQGLRQDLAKNRSQKTGKYIEELRKTISPKRSTGDIFIRDQFKQFIRQMDFHKGIYFLTADKSNAALSRAEGLFSIYYPLPNQKEVQGIKSDGEVKPVRIPCGKSTHEPITLSVPLGKLIYELAVQFGNIKINWEDDEIEIRCDPFGASLDHWVNRELTIKNQRVLIDNYATNGKISLDNVERFWSENFSRENQENSYVR